MNNSKISIKGVPSKYDEQVLKELQAGYHNVYESTDQHCAVVRDKLAFSFLEKVVEMSAAGYVLTSRYPVSTSPADYSAYMTKPLEIQLADLVVIDENVKQKYIAKLQVELTEYREQLTQQLLQSAALKETEKVEKAKQKLLAEIAKEVNDAFGELIVPD